MRKRKRAAFTLIELLVVVAIISLLVSIMLPSLSLARELARKTACKVGIRTLQIGNEMYQADHLGFYAPGAANFGGNLHRWFGSRSSVNQPFSEGAGPLSRYMPNGVVKACPNFKDFARGFETGAGGYGYNNAFVGSFVVPDGGAGFDDAYKPGGDNFDRTGNRATAFLSPAETVAFTDAAFVNAGLTEYGFCDPPRWAIFNFAPRPSIHFRHRDAACIVWLDSHVTEETMTFTNNVCGFIYPGKPEDYNVGWFGPNSIELFDCQ